MSIALLLLFVEEANAQCAMCKAVTESSSQADPNQLNTGAGINKGIIYIMFIPYLLLGFLFWHFFKDRIKGFLLDMGVIGG
ncbi:hypothetical protein [Luteibaculum oceani]|uniref:hypothetical protein n=1 Tax=Luteibaculum oceani TaxID=1294296 RepID=UPI001CB94113|nr:hypothetical protein [Luteibaculum oceani]